MLFLSCKKEEPLVYTGDIAVFTTYKHYGGDPIEDVAIGLFDMELIDHNGWLFSDQAFQTKNFTADGKIQFNDLNEGNYFLCAYEVDDLMYARVVVQVKRGQTTTIEWK